MGTTVTARRASLGEKTMQAAAKADEPDEAMRKAARPARLRKLCELPTDQVQDWRQELSVVDQVDWCKRLRKLCELPTDQVQDWRQELSVVDQVDWCKRLRK